MRSGCFWRCGRRSAGRQALQSRLGSDDADAFAQQAVRELVMFAVKVKIGGSSFIILHGRA
jgi:hypothetical protein